MMRTARLGNKIVGDGQPCFISFEPGATHTGLASARQLVRAAHAAGADAVKFQTIDTDELMSSEEYMVEYATSTGQHKESVHAALKRRELSFAQWRELKAYCDELGILFISCPSGPATVDLLAEIGVAAIKVAKADINNRPLIRLIAAKKLPVILDARERFTDVEIACAICEEAGVKDIIIMHCPAGYPAEYAGIHLRAIPAIKNLFNYPVAYSDHSVGSYMNFVALGMGANYLEKTITLNRETDAVEHFMSLEPDEMRDFVQQIRAAEAALGDPRILFNSRVQLTHRRSIMVNKAIRAGQTIAFTDLAFKRPGTHFPVDRYEEVVGKKATCDLAANTFITERDFA